MDMVLATFMIKIKQGFNQPPHPHNTGPEFEKKNAKNCELMSAGKVRYSDTAAYRVNHHQRLPLPRHCTHIPCARSKNSVVGILHVTHN
jgi:hypothetical protein